MTTATPGPIGLALILALASNTAPARVEGKGEGEVSTKTFTYKQAPEADLEMVVHLPHGWEPSDSRPAIVFFFGGGWRSGSIGQFEDQADDLARLGMVAARADYRVKSRHGVSPDACVEDARSAVRWLRKHAGELGLDPSKIVAAGGSAGAHIAACTELADAPDAPGEDASIQPAPAALVLYNPVLDVTIPRLADRFDDPSLAARISPTRHVAGGAAPTLLLYGTDDRLIEQGREFLEVMKSKGNRAEMYTAEGQGHGFFNRPPWKARTTRRVVEFLASLGYVEAPAPESP